MVNISENGNKLTEAIRTIILFIYYWLEGIVLSVIPSRFQRKSVTGEKVLITGAGSGIGRLLSIEFAKLGCELILWDINEEGNKQTAKQVKLHGAKVHDYKLDLSDDNAIYTTAALVRKEVGEVDILINNAGIVTGKKFMESSDNLIKKTISVNLQSNFWTAKAFLPSMMNRNHGHLVSIASAAAIFGATGLADYCASKSAVVGFDDSLRDELMSLGKDGVITTVVCPFYINTGMFDGVKSKFPMVLPILDPDYVVSKIVDAILTNQRMLMIPRILYFLNVLKSVLPIKAGNIANKFMGVSSSMDEFKGRCLKSE